VRFDTDQHDVTVSCDVTVLRQVRRWRRRCADNFPAKSSSTDANVRSHETADVDERNARGRSSVHQSSKVDRLLS